MDFNYPQNDYDLQHRNKKKHLFTFWQQLKILKLIVSMVVKKVM